MRLNKIVFLLALVFPAVGLTQQSAEKPQAHPPDLPVIDYDACPFEGCHFGKWIVAHKAEIFTTWKNGRRPWATLAKGDIVTGLSGVHITYEPDRVKVLQAIPELNLKPGDIILRYMYRGEGFADIWVNGQFMRNYDSTFIVEKDKSGCLQDCPAQVVSDGRKDWWVRLRTAEGKIGWAKVEDQFDCMDSFGGEPECDKL